GVGVHAEQGPGAAPVLDLVGYLSRPGHDRVDLRLLFLGLRRRERRQQTDRGHEREQTSGHRFPPTAVCDGNKYRASGRKATTHFDKFVWARWAGQPACWAFTSPFRFAYRRSANRSGTPSFAKIDVR